MNASVKPSQDGQYVDIFVPMQFRQSRIRRLIIAPANTGVRKTARHDSTLLKAVARAFRWQRLLENGTYATIRQLADAERINASYVSRTLRITLLAPDIVEAILDGVQPATLRLADLESAFPIEWREQRTKFGFRQA